MREQRWERFAKQIEEERNPIRIAELAKELNEAMLAELPFVGENTPHIASEVGCMTEWFCWRSESRQSQQEARSLKPLITKHSRRSYR